MLALPHFDTQVPLLIDADGVGWVPLADLCRLVGVNSTRAILRTQRIALWYQARLFQLHHGTRTVHAWCLPMSQATGLFLGRLATFVQDTDLLRAIRLTDHDAMTHSAAVRRQAQARFEAGRQEMYRLASAIVQNRSVLDHLATHRDQWTVVQQRRLDALTAGYQAFSEQAETFVRRWIADVQALPVIEGFHVDAHGQAGEMQSVTLFGTFSAADHAELIQYSQELNRQAKLIIAFVEDLRS